MPQNEMPIMNIRAKYADETGSGQNIDEAIASIEEAIAEIAPSLYGKFVRVIDAPESDTVDQDTFDIIKEGVFMKGTWLGLKNPIVIPFHVPEGADAIYTVIIGGDGPHTYYSNTNFRFLLVRPATRNFELMNEGITFNNSIGHHINISKLRIVNGKEWPRNYPSDSENKVLACVNGILQWVQNALTDIGPEYDATATYALGALVLHDGVLYKCTTAIATAEEWDATHWTAVLITDLLGSIEASQINSGSATSGQVLTADGSGGAQWGASPSPHLYQHSIFWDHKYNQGSQKWRITINVLLASATPVTSLSDMLGVIDLFAIDAMADERSGGIAVRQYFVNQNTGSSEFMINIVKRGSDYRVTYGKYSSSQWYINGEGIELSDSSDSFIDTVTQIF